MLAMLPRVLGPRTGIHLTLPLSLSRSLSPQAHCVFASTPNVSCVCNVGWSGDGLVCVEINNCDLASRGGCSPDADCIYIGPEQVRPSTSKIRLQIA